MARSNALLYNWASHDRDRVPFGRPTEWLDPPEAEETMPIFKKHIFPITIILITLAITALGDQAIGLFIYSRSAIQSGEFWRMITGHLVHTEYPHLFLNQAGLLLVWFLFGPRLGLLQWALATVFCALFISAAFFALDPEINYYVGLSAVLKGFFILGCLLEIRHGNRTGWALLALFVGLTVWEQIKGELPGTGALVRGQVATNAHLFGAVAGAVVYGLMAGIRKLSK